MNLYSYQLCEQDNELLRRLLPVDSNLFVLAEGTVLPEEISFLIIPTASFAQRLPGDLTKKEISIFCWDELNRYLLESSWRIYCSAEQYFLKFALERACSPSTHSVLLGSSYAKYGLSAAEMGEDCVNLGLDAQDIYYTCKLGMRVIEQNRSIRHIVLASGYYWFYSDLSRADSEYARALISETYYPIFKDAHHIQNTEAIAQHQNKFLQLPFLDESHVLQHYCKQFYEDLGGESAKVTRRFIFHQANGWQVCNEYLRTPNDQINWGKLPWHLIPDAIKDELARARCRDHNKLLRHSESFQENKETLNRFISFCNHQGVCVYVLCMPQTDHYLRYLDAKLKQDYYAALDCIEGDYIFLDFHGVELLGPEDYMDQDHLNPSGAKKITHFAKELVDTYE